MTTIDAREGIIDVLHTKKIQFDNTSTISWWKKSSKLSSLNKGSTVRNINPEKTVMNALGPTKYVVGTDTDKWIFRVHIGGSIRVGVSYSTQELETDLDTSTRIVTPLDVEDSGVVEFTLTKKTLLVTYGSTTIIVDITMYDGQSVYPLLMVDALEVVSIALESAQILTIYVGNDGVPVLDTSKSIGVSNAISIITNGSTLYVDDVIVGLSPAVIASNIPLYNITSGEMIFAPPVTDSISSIGYVKDFAYSSTNKCIILTYEDGTNPQHSHDGRIFNDMVTLTALFDYGLATYWYIKWAATAGVFVAIAINKNNDGAFMHTSTDGAVYTYHEEFSVTPRIVNRGFIEAFGNFYLTIDTVSSPNNIALSTDIGVTWSIVTHPQLYVKAFAYGAGVLVAVGGGSSVIYTTDGVNWSQIPISDEMNGVCYSEELKLFVATGYTNFASTYTSIDGINWIEHPNQGWATQARDVEFVPELEFFITRSVNGDDANVWISRNGVTWKGVYFNTNGGGYKFQYTSGWGMMFLTDNTVIGGDDGRIYFTVKRYQNDGVQLV
jgi:hypothetical protein